MSLHLTRPRLQSAAVLALVILAIVLGGCGGMKRTNAASSSTGGTSSLELLFIADNSTGPSPLIHSFYLDIETGHLQETASPTKAVWARPLVVDPKGRFLYAGPVQTTAQGIWGYSIDATSGELTPMSGSPFFSQFGGSAVITIDPSGKFLYDDGQAYSINQTTGSLAPLTNFTGVGPAVITKDGIGIQFFCPMLNGPGTLSSYRIDSSGNAVNLANLTVTCASGDPAVDPTGKFVYVSAAVFQLDPGTGNLVQTPGSFPLQPVAFDPFGRFVYATEVNNPSAIDAYSINPATGALALVAGSPFNVQLGLGDAAVDPSGKFLVTALESTFSIDQTTGALTPVQPAQPLNTTAVAFYPPKK